MLHPVALASVALLLVNDHVLKTTVTGFVSGKLSDLRRPRLFPVVGSWSLGGPAGRTRPLAAADDLFAWRGRRVDWGGLRPGENHGRWFDGFRMGPWLAPVVAIAGWSALTGAAVPRALAVTVVQDPSDLIALVALVVALVLGLARLPGRGLGLMVSKTS